jgi:hypothetical protein
MIMTLAAIGLLQVLLPQFEMLREQLEELRQQAEKDREIFRKAAEALLGEIERAKFNPPEIRLVHPLYFPDFGKMDC